MKNPFAFVLTLSIFVFLIRIGSSSRDSRNSKYLKLDDYPENVNNTSEKKVQNALSVFQQPEIYKNNSNIHKNYTNPNETRYRAVIESKQHPLIYSNSTSLVQYNKYADLIPAKTVLARKHHHHDDSHDEHDEHEEESHSEEHGSYETGV
jgi:hypothetical protein